MSQIKIAPPEAGSGTVTLTAPETNSNRSQSLPDASGALDLAPPLPTLLTGSRAVNTDYTNNSGRTRRVMVYGSNGTASLVMQVSFNGGTTWFRFAGSALPSGVAIGFGTIDVPPGATYRVRAESGTLSINEWWEQ